MGLLGPLSPLESPARPEKKVRFAPFTEICRGIPWSYSPTKIGRSDLVQSDAENLSPLHGNLRESVCALRTQVKATDQIPVIGVLLLLICLCALFLLIFFLVRVVLLLEVDSELNSHAGRQILTFD